VDKLAFTGSVTTGARVAEAGAKSVKNVSLELGGKSPVVVFEDVDIDAVVDWIMLGIFFNSGQVCSATSRLLVQSSIKDKLLEQLVKQAKNIKVGDGLHEATLMGPIVNETQYKKVLSYINQGVQEGPQISLRLIPTSLTRLSCYRGYYLVRWRALNGQFETGLFRFAHDFGQRQANFHCLARGNLWPRALSCGV
jgi:acyl-CoA reductase-like NAD-dependent aldehyde dehydrogenase